NLLADGQTGGCRSLARLRRADVVDLPFDFPLALRVLAFVNRFVAVVAETLPVRAHDHVLRLGQVAFRKMHAVRARQLAALVDVAVAAEIPVGDLLAARVEAVDRFAEIVAVLALDDVLGADELAAVHRLEAVRVAAHAARQLAAPAMADEKL